MIEPVNLDRTSRRVTLEQVAEMAGLGRTTVSDILNRNVADRYSDETRRRVQEAVKSLGYSPARAAQQLARGRSGQIGLLLTRDFSNPFFARLADYVERDVRHRGLRLQIALTDGNPETELARIHQMRSDDVEGLLIGPVYEQIDLDQHRHMLSGRLPILLFGGEVGSEFDEIFIDHTAALNIAVAHLVANGHQKIGYLCAPHPRAQGGTAVRSFHALGNLDAGNLEWVVWQDDTGDYADYFTAAQKFASLWMSTRADARPTAMVCHNDQAAMTALAALTAAGIRVPQDLSIVGFDNLPESAYLVPALTTVDNHSEQLMTVAVETLLQRIQNPDLSPVRRAIKPTLVCRQSVRSL